MDVRDLPYQNRCEIGGGLVAKRQGEDLTRQGVVFGGRQIDIEFVALQRIVGGAREAAQGLEGLAVRRAGRADQHPAAFVGAQGRQVAAGGGEAPARLGVDRGIADLAERQQQGLAQDGLGGRLARAGVIADPPDLRRQQRRGPDAERSPLGAGAVVAVDAGHGAGLLEPDYRIGVDRQGGAQA